MSTLQNRDIYRVAKKKNKNGSTTNNEYICMFILTYDYRRHATQKAHRDNVFVFSGFMHSNDLKSVKKVPLSDGFEVSILLGKMYQNVVSM